LKYCKKNESIKCSGKRNPNISKDLENLNLSTALNSNYRTPMPSIPMSRKVSPMVTPYQESAFKKNEEYWRMAEQERQRRTERNVEFMDSTYQRKRVKQL